MAASNEQSGNGRADASAFCQITFSASLNFGFANSNMSEFKSVATISIVAGNTSRNRRVTIPVPQAISRTRSYFLFVFFFNDTATTEIYTLSLHDALPI